MSCVAALLEYDGSGQAADKAIQSPRSKYSTIVSDMSLPKDKPTAIADNFAPLEKYRRRRTTSLPNKMDRVSSAGAKQLD
jgi:hypothetical protein